MNIEITGMDGVTQMMVKAKSSLKDLKPAFTDAGIRMQRVIALRFQNGNGWPKSIRAMREGGKTMLLSNRLRNSIAFKIPAGQGKDGSAEGVWQLQEQSLFMGTNAWYARILHHGGVITPRRAKALVVPLNKDARRALVGAGSQGVRGIEGLTFIPRKGKAPLLVKDVVKGRGKNRGVVALEPWFILMKSVRVPARPYMYFDEKDLAMIERVFARHVDEDVKPERPS